MLSLRSVPEVQQLAVLCGKSHSVRLFTWDLPPDSPGVKIPEAKGCQVITTGLVCQGSTTVLCAASKRQVVCFQLTNRKGLPRRIKEFQAAGVVQCMDILGERLCVGFTSGFSLYPLLNEGAPLNFPSPDDPKLTFLMQAAPDALCAARLALSEYLLCFSTFGIYVNADGKKSRSQEIMWPAPPLACCEYSTGLSSHFYFLLSFTSCEFGFLFAITIWEVILLIGMSTNLCNLIIHSFIWFWNLVIKLWASYGQWLIVFGNKKLDMWNSKMADSFFPLISANGGESGCPIQIHRRATLCF